MGEGKKSFEQLVKEMEEMVGELEKGDLSLEDSIKYFKGAMALSKKLTKMLDDIDGKISVLIEEGDNQIKEVDFETDE